VSGQSGKRHKKSALDELKGYGEQFPIEGFHLVTIHPLADEEALLKKLDMTPDQCKHVDWWWAFQGDLVLVSLSCWFPDTPPHTNYFKFPKNERRRGHGKRFYVVTRTCPLTTETVRNVLLNLKNWWLQNKTVVQRQTGKSLPVRVSDLDFGELQT
jgi:hypothetical protein